MALLPQAGIAVELDAVLDDPELLARAWRCQTAAGKLRGSRVKALAQLNCSFSDARARRLCRYTSQL